MRTLITSISSALLMACCAPLYASELTAEQAASLYTMAHGLTRYPMPEKPPLVHIVSNARLQEMGCKNACPGIHAVERYGEVFIDAALDMSDPYDASIVFHEFVHFLQWANKGDATSCEEWEAREEEAYRLQGLVLEKSGSNRRMQPHSVGICL